MTAAAADLVSVVIPTYNRAALVTEAVESVLAQTHSAVELIVVDDGSTDGTAEALAHYDGVRLWRQANQGQGAARQAGLEIAAGRYLATLDSDDLWDPGFLAESLRALRETGAGFVFANWRTLGMDGESIAAGHLASLPYLSEAPAAESADSTEWRVLSPEATRRIFARHCPAPSSSFLVDRRLVTRGWDTGYRVSDDWAFLLELVLDQQVSSAYRLDPLWSKRLDGTNIYDRHPDPAGLAAKEIHDLERLLAQNGARLDAEERAFLQERLAIAWGDLAHFQSLAPGTRRRALASALKACRLRADPRRVALAAKCLLRSAAGLRR